MNFTEDNFLYPDAEKLQNILNTLDVALKTAESEQQLRIQTEQKLSESLKREEALKAENTILHIPDWEKEANRLFETIDKFIKLKIPYKFDANYFTDGCMDCSLFNRIVKLSNAVKLPRSSREQAKVGIEIPIEQIRRGDRLHFDPDGDGTISHCGIYAGNGILAHTNKFPLLPRYQTLESYGQRIVIARRD